MINSAITESLTLILNAVTIAIIYFNLKIEDQRSIQNIHGVFIIIACQMIIGYSYAVIRSLPAQIPLIRQETGENLYPFSVYYVAEFLKSVSTS